MANTIKVKRHSSYNESKNPTTNQLEEGELGWNNHGGRLWIGKKTSASNVSAYEITPPIATSSIAGKASFSNTNFNVGPSGAVTITAVPTTVLTGTVTNAQLAGSITQDKLAGSIPNAKLVSPKINVNTQDVALGGNLTIQGTSNEVTVGTSGTTLTVGLPDDVTVGGDLTITGDLKVTGTVDTISATDTDIVDKTITLAKGSADAATANGSGIVIDGGGAQMTYSNSGSGLWQFNKPLDVTGAVTSSGVVSARGGNSTSWNTAYSWGNHASAGYLTGLGTALLDADFSSNGIMKRTGAGAYGIVTDNSSNWNTAYGWGNHGSVGYLTSLGTALVDADFTGNGLMKRTSAGNYTSVTDNSSNWDTAYSTRFVWDGSALGNSGAQSTARSSIGVTQAWVQSQHTTQSAISVNTSGKQVIDNISVNTNGHVTAVGVETRTYIEAGDTIDGGTVTWS